MGGRKDDQFSTSFMNFMFRDNGLDAATRQQLKTRMRIDKINHLEEYRQASEIVIKEKRDIADFYRSHYQSKEE